MLAIGAAIASPVVNYTKDDFGYLTNGGIGTTRRARLGKKSNGQLNRENARKKRKKEKRHAKKFNK